MTGVLGLLKCHFKIPLEEHLNITGCPIFAISRNGEILVSSLTIKKRPTFY